MEKDSREADLFLSKTIQVEATALWIMPFEGEKGASLVAWMGKNLPVPAEGNGYPPQYSCLENSMDRGE